LRSLWNYDCILMACIRSVHRTEKARDDIIRPMKKAALVIACCCAVVVLSCTKERDGGGEKVPVEDEVKVSESTRRVTEKPSETMTMELVEDESPGSGKAEERQTKPPLPGKEFLLARQTGEPVAGEDLVIGKLHNVSAGTEAENRVFSGIERFLQSLTEGTLAEDAAAPEALADLKRLAGYNIERGNIPEDFRIGEIFIEGSSGRADVRLFGQPGRAAGEIYCIEENGAWLITDMQVDLAELGHSYEIEGPYEPNVYRWIHQY
jgi:hypothetical protein